MAGASEPTPAPEEVSLPASSISPPSSPDTDQSYYDPVVEVPTPGPVVTELVPVLEEGQLPSPASLEEAIPIPPPRGQAVRGQRCWTRAKRRNPYPGARGSSCFFWASTGLQRRSGADEASRPDGAYG